MRQFECNDGIEGDLLEDFVLSATEVGLFLLPHLISTVILNTFQIQ